MTPDSILAVLDRLRRNWPADWICLTGGEPFVQDLAPLVGPLHARGFRIQVETNGTCFRDAGIDWVTVSPKPPGFETAPEIRNLAREVKLVVSKEISFPVLRRVRSNFPPGIPLFLQPESNRGSSRARALRLLRRALKEGLPDVRVGVQLHKIYALR